MRVHPNPNYNVHDRHISWDFFSSHQARGTRDGILEQVPEAYKDIDAVPGGNCPSHADKSSCSGSSRSHYRETVAGPSTAE